MAQAALKHSTSIGAYLDSVELVNLDPAKTIFHPSLQQIGVFFSHSQNFCSK